MLTPLVLTVIGPDQPGLVEALSRTVATHGGSWENSRMARLAGLFAGILEVRVSQEHSQALFNALQGLEGQGLRVVVEDASELRQAPSYRELQLELIGQDRPGIIRDVSAALAEIGVNVVELGTACKSAPMSGGRLFTADAVLHIPDACSIDLLRETLEKVGADLMVDIRVEEAAS